MMPRRSVSAVSLKGLLSRPAAAAVLLALLASGAPLLAGGKGSRPPRRQPANVMSFEGASWLEREGRDQLEKPELVLAAMDLRPGMKVAEIGAGTGYFSRRLARAVGRTGKIYAVDIQSEMLDLLKKYAGEEGLTNIVSVLGTETDPKLPPRGIDRILLVDVYHEFQKPEPMLARIRQSLAPGGTVTLVEYRLEGESASHINLAHRMSVEQVLAEWQAGGFELVNRIETLPSQHLFVFSARRGAREPSPPPPSSPVPAPGEEGPGMPIDPPLFL